MREWIGWVPEPPERVTGPERGERTDSDPEEFPEQESGELTLIDSETFFDLLMEQQEQM